MVREHNELAAAIAAEVLRALAKGKPLAQPEWLPTKVAAIYLGVDPDYLQSLRAEGTGPKWSRPRGVARVVRYRRSDLDAWMESGGQGGQ